MPSRFNDPANERRLLLRRHGDIDDANIVIVEQLFNRLVARAQGRPASQDPLPVDGPSAARLVIVRELLHHWRLDGLRLTA